MRHRSVRAVSLLNPVAHGDLVRLSNGQIIECRNNGAGDWVARDADFRINHFRSQVELIDWLVARDDAAHAEHERKTKPAGAPTPSGFLSTDA